jgi:hypothetical protein
MLFTNEKSKRIRENPLNKNKIKITPIIFFRFMFLGKIVFNSPNRLHTG